MAIATMEPRQLQPMLETIDCYDCGGSAATDFILAQDDLTGKPGNFRFVKCDRCGLVYQNPRIALSHIRDYYDDEYIAHRKKSDWGILTWFYNQAMNKHDRQKERLVRRYVQLDKQSNVLDVGCGAGTFLARVRSRTGAHVAGVDFKDLSHLPAFAGMEFHCGLFYEQQLAAASYDLVTMWHFLEHDYDPLRTLDEAKRVLKPNGRLVIEVPRLDSLSFRLYHERWPGLQAPQHTVLYDRAKLLRFVEKAGLQVVDYLPYGAFPPYFYLFAGLAFKWRQGKGIDLSRAIYPYFLGQIVLSPVLLFERYLNLAMQTVVCRRIP
ncbi:MAG: class I SAM-dependent methyltransferase [Planctomycetes bacterium]|nr:class I SAM-dependent methyltransferase [Planctomycetota bacterium]